MHRGKAPDKRSRILFIENCYRLYEQKMYQAAYRILYDCAKAEDAVQDAFLKLMKGRVYFEDAASDDCKKYMITVIRHSAIDIYNRKKREQQFLCFLDEKADADKLAFWQSPQESIDMKELISDLPPRYYKVVDCLAIEGLSVKETSMELGISEENVRKRFERAKKMLRGAGDGDETKYRRS